jgi:hypothetical protein
MSLPFPSWKLIGSDVIGLGKLIGSVTFSRRIYSGFAASSTATVPFCLLELFRLRSIIHGVCTRKAPRCRGPLLLLSSYQKSQYCCPPLGLKASRPRR